MDKNSHFWWIKQPLLGGKTVTFEVRNSYFWESETVTFGSETATFGSETVTFGCKTATFGSETVTLGVKQPL